MKTLSNYTGMLLATFLTLALLSSCPSAASAEEASRWNLKTSLAVLDTDSPFSLDKPSGGQVHAGGDASVGVAFSIEYRLSELVGLEFGTVYAKTPDVKDTAEGDSYELGEGPSFWPLMAGANFHLVDSESFDFYVGPRVAYVNFGDFDLDVDGETLSFDVENEFAWGATIGVNYEVGNGQWALVAEVTYLDLDMEVLERGADTVTVDGFDPLMVSVGAAYRF